MSAEQEKELRKKLHVNRNYVVPHGSIMYRGRICNHDDGILCEHRLYWLIEWIKKELK